METFNIIASLLREGQDLAGRFGDHLLQGDFVGYHECHITGDCLLVYEINHEGRFVRLFDIGNHANLFE